MQGADSVVIAALKRSPSQLAATHEKIFPVSSCAGVAVSGLVSDGQQVISMLRNVAINSSFVYDSEASVSKLCGAVVKKLQVWQKLVHDNVFNSSRAVRNTHLDALTVSVYCWRV